MSAYDEAVRLLPPNMAAAVAKTIDDAEEFRLRIGFLPTAFTSGSEDPVCNEPVTREDIASVLEKATNASVHTVQPDMAKGFISCRLGIRIGVCGTGIVHGSDVSGLRDISSVSIRIPHEIIGCGGMAIEHICADNRANVLILSPPGAGKTTFARECIRRLAEGGTRVGVADERCELAAMFKGQPGFDIGRCTDVMSDMPKSSSAMMLLRSMNPQVIVMDEISTPNDCRAVLSAIGCGVRIIATAHAYSASELHMRPVYSQLLSSAAFTKAVSIKNINGVRSYSWEDLQ